MKPYFEAGLSTIYNADCLEVLREMPDDSIDLLATDPPYGLSPTNNQRHGMTQKATKGFMCKAWDVLPDIEIWRECLRVLKPGAFAFVMCIPRQDCLSRMIISLEDAGFNVSYSPIYWVTAQGFPKAQNISKAVDKRNGRTLKLYKEIGRHIKVKREASGYTIKQMNEMFGYVAGCAWWESQNDNNVRLPNLPDWLRLKELIGTDDKYTEIIKREEAIGGKIGERIRGNAGFSKEQVSRPWKEHIGEEYDITAASTPQAKALDGSYTMNLKPAVEVVLVVQKPMTSKTYVGQALLWYEEREKLKAQGIPEDQLSQHTHQGLGSAWLDDCRIPYESEGDIVSVHGYQGEDAMGAMKGNPVKGQPQYTQPQGRFPSHLLVSDNALDDGRGHKSSGIYKQGGNVEWYGGKSDFKHTAFNDSGSFSRYFSLDKWFEERLRQLPASVQKTFPFLLVPKASKSEKNKGCEELPEKQMYKCDGSGQSLEIFGTTDGGRKPRSNTHPTVKSLKLFSYLITLGSREGDTVLDPFMGSGTTILAAQMLGRKGIGIELDAGYVEIAKARLSQARLL